MIKVTKTGKRIAISGATTSDDTMRKIIEAINEIQRTLGLVETDFTGGDTDEISKYKCDDKVL